MNTHLPINQEKGELLHAVALTRVKGIGPVLARKLVGRFGSASAVFREGPSVLRKMPGIGRVLSSAIQDRSVLETAEQELAGCRANGIDILSFPDPAYPSRLKSCPDAPFVLYTRGRCSWADLRVVSVVGSRRSTEYGRRLATDLVRCLSGMPVVIASGLALGIDAHAHRSALSTGLPTAAVLAHGLDSVYPAVHRRLAREIAEAGGVLLSEYTLGTPPERMHFPARNRIIAGLADAVVVVESAERGGALITADIANSYHREVFTFPGRVGDGRSAGCLGLIRSHRAAMIRSGEDLLEAMGWDGGMPAGRQVTAVEPPVGLTDLERSIFRKLYSVPGAVPVDELLELGRGDTESVRSGLLRLELDGWIRSAPGNSFVKA